ncbi:MAG: low molecular weight phosphotyrosine protein phosphatase, partial [Pseudomonadota bacterium]
MKIRVLFVCLGNICRSPTAEGAFRKLVQEQGLAKHVEIDSAGTHAYHVGAPPDARAQQAARQRGIDMSGLRGSQATAREIEQ